ncbi:serine hydrolase domain-containing protein [Gordonia alkanivorans]|nr:serine hydrolase domain-containing protein [Gordonia alkanivorans]MDH3007080.1 serine hydrolase [Gordonia alkanivorans]MDH3013266.1 serine hydrolase [Gordonia alkanivorans]MDH3015046.1 serine hydrolase [Gordonia alkanivorans]MDH3040144.1 serine hydrolase [Gordonia alkanivorans]MDH3045710.1 serine hydrolase [Gordonia alkanivorans]
MSATLDDTIEELLVPGALALIQTPAGTYTVSAGTTTMGDDIAPAAADQFRIGSVTKTMTVAAVLQLIQEEKIGVNDPIDKSVLGVPEGSEITIAQLMSMRSGLHNYLDTDGFRAAFGSDPTKVWAPSELLALGFSQPSGFAPGTQFDYSNTNTVLLGLVVEKAEDKSLAQVFADRFFGPLGLTRTSLPAATDTTLSAPFSHGYQYGPLQVSDKPMTPEETAAARAGSLLPNDVTVMSPSWAWAAGGVVSTADDLMTWIKAFVGGDLLDDANQQLWWDSIRIQHDEDPRVFYGYGITEVRFGENRLTYHEGQLPGFNTMAVHDEANDVSMVVWTNLSVTQDVDNAFTVMARLLQHIYNTPADTPPAR